MHFINPEPFCERDNTGRMENRWTKLFTWLGMLLTLTELTRAFIMWTYRKQRASSFGKGCYSIKQIGHANRLRMTYHFSIELFKQLSCLCNELGQSCIPYQNRNICIPSSHNHFPTIIIALQYTIIYTYVIYVYEDIHVLCDIWTWRKVHILCNRSTWNMQVFCDIGEWRYMCIM